MKKIILGTLLLSMTLIFTGCDSEELQTMEPNKEESVEIEEEEIEEPVIEKSEERLLCDEIYDMHKLITYYEEDQDTFKILATKKMEDLIGDGSDVFKLTAGTTDIIGIMKSSYDLIDSKYDKEFNVLFQTTDGYTSSLFRTNDGMYYVNVFGVTIEDINDWVTK